MKHIIYLFFNKIPTFWSSDVNKAILAQVKVME